MKRFDSEKIIPRYFFFVVFFIFIALFVVGKSVYIMTVQRDYWLKAAERQSFDSITVSPTRGNIYDCKGRLLASTLPEYRLYVDFRPMRSTKTDTLWAEKIDSICDGLNRIFPDRTADRFKEILSAAFKDTVSYCLIWPKNVDYGTMQQVKELPIFRLSGNKGGFAYEKLPTRTLPNGNLAARTIGKLEKETWNAHNGIELACDSFLCGANGMKHRDKILNRYVDIVDIPAIDGADVITTIDISMQDIAEKALRDMLKRPEVHGDKGVAIVMEVQTGDVKAIVNLSKLDDGEYYEDYNYALSYACEPGSVFKTASVLAAMDDGRIDTSLCIATGNGEREMYGAKMRDHNRNSGGCGTINIAKAMEKSSNIGVSVAIDERYKHSPEKFIDALDRIGIRDSLPIPIQGYSKPFIRYPRQRKDGTYAFDAKTVLPWMSIGYETKIAPINTVTFYNAIANNGKMVAPRFVKQITKDGKVVKDYPVQVMRESICKNPQAITTMQTVLQHVVTQGTGKCVRSTMIPIAGKTGTAQVAHANGGYKNGVITYWLSFAGYFPADQPMYSCIVCIEKKGSPASGGLMSGVVVKNIAEGIMASTVKREKTTGAKGSPLPEVTPGNILAADYVLNTLGFNCQDGWAGNFATGNPVWGTARNTSDKSIAFVKNDLSSVDIMPDVTGMGARDAVYLLEGLGLKVRLSGRGKVVEQSLQPGCRIRKNQTCVLNLDVKKPEKNEPDSSSPQPAALPVAPVELTVSDIALASVPTNRKRNS